MLAFFIYLVAEEGLRHWIELVHWVLVARLIVMAPIVVGVLDLVMFLKQLFMDQFACESVPEGHHVESVDRSDQVILLLPD